MKIIDIYQQYQIMPNLQLHMMRVAAVAQTIGEHILDTLIDQRAMIMAALLHDMGNILKFDLTYFPDFLQPEGLNYWQTVKNDYQNKYGSDEHLATITIAQEIGVSNKVIQLIQSIGFDKVVENLLVDDYEKKICSYADIRVDPYQIVSLEVRLADLEKRYKKKHLSMHDQQLRVNFNQEMKTIEQQIFQKCNISPHDITNDRLNGTIRSLNFFLVD